MSTTVTPVQNTQVNGELVNIMSPEMLIRQRLEAERKRLEKEAGIERKEVHHFHKPIELPFTKLQRDHTTILFGGLTWKHERLVHAALESLGYKCESVPVPNKKAFQLGKEYGNNGQCNPTYFTVGNLVQFAQDLEAKGLTKDEICDRYVFFTAGACGPCRFGMYESEYRLALRNAGFDKFRVLLFQQSGGLNQAEAEAGLEMNVDFFLAILNALNIGDIINDVAYQIRPYEVNAGETDRVLEESMEMLHEVMRRRQPWLLHGKTGDLLKKTNFAGTAEFIGKFLNQLFGDGIMAGLREVRERFAAIPIDRTRVKPIVKITGEFWAQTTEGDGNFNMFRFLEKEGAQVVVEPIGTWICYLMHQVVQQARDEKGLEEGATPPPSWRLDKRMKINLRMQQEDRADQGRRSHFQARVQPHHRRAGRHGPSPGRPVRTAAPRPSLLQFARRRRRRPPGSRQEHLLLEQGSGAHGSGAQALRLHALDAIRRRAVGGHVPLQGHDLPARRNLRRRRRQRPQPRANGARRSQGQDQAGIQGVARRNRPDARRDSRLRRRASGNEVSPVQSPTHRGRDRPGGQLRPARRRAHEGGRDYRAKL